MHNPVLRNGRHLGDVLRPGLILDHLQLQVSFSEISLGS
jgi:hypothetical protein